MSDSGRLILTCEEVDGFLVDYIDGRLPFWAAFRFRLHLLGCRQCRIFLSDYRRTIALERKAFRDDETVAPEALVAAILAARPE